MRQHAVQPITVNFGIRIEQHKVIVRIHRRTTIAANDKALVLLVSQQGNECLIREIG